MNKKIFFDLAKSKGILDCDLMIKNSRSLEISVFKGSVEHFTVASSGSIKARGIVGGKFGVASTNKDDSLTPMFLVSEILDTAKLIEKDDPAIIFEGSPKYKRFNTFNQDVEDMVASKKVEMAKNLEKKVISLDSRITDVEVMYRESSDECKIFNSKGLSLKRKNNFLMFYVQVVAKADGEIKSGGDYVFSNKFEDLDLDKLAEKVVKETVSKFHSIQCKSTTYPVILKQDVACSLISAALSSLSSEEVQKHTSVLEGKLNQKIASSKLTIYDDPLMKNIFFSAFDDEGVATKKKCLIKSGVLKMFLYNLETAAKDHVESTGNASSAGSKMGISPSFVFVKPGKSSFEDLLLQANNGVYITEVEGLGTGLNPASGDFSVQASGYLIKDGKIDTPLSLITLSGNLFKMLSDIKAMGNDSEISASGMSNPSILIKKLSVGGK